MHQGVREFTQLTDKIMQMAPITRPPKRIFIMMIEEKDCHYLEKQPKQFPKSHKKLRSWLEFEDLILVVAKILQEATELALRIVLRLGS